MIYKYKIIYSNLNKYQKGGGGESYCYLCGAPIHNFRIFKLNNYKKYR